MYYGLIILSVVMFGGTYILKDLYRKIKGSSLKISLEFMVVSSLIGAVALFLTNGMKFEFTTFTLIMALISAVLDIAFTFCGFKALGYINLSLYSLFSMLGGMALPFLQGIFFYGEALTVAKIVCVIFICAALLLTVEKGEKTKGSIYYIGIFVLNGLFGVNTNFFTEAPFLKTSATGFSLLSAICGCVLSLVLLLILYPRKKGEAVFSPKSLAVSSACGTVTHLANLLLVIALAHVDASVQYPMVTGGVMIVSTIICFFGKNKPTKREVLSIALAFLGMLAIFLIPV